ncbi:MAG: BON domain-containing protein [Sulfuricellaceae bacterium]
MKKLGLTALLVLLPTLQGCFPIAATGVGVGVALVDDRRTSGAYIEDEGIELKAFHRLSERFDMSAHFNVTSYNRQVLLTGEVADQAAKEEAEKIVRGIPNVKKVYNELTVGGMSALAERSNDTYITSKVKMRFVDANKFSITYVRVVTEGGVVYLLGMVTRREADDAVEIARTTTGVRKVVKLFGYIDEKSDAGNVKDKNDAGTLKGKNDAGTDKDKNDAGTVKEKSSVGDVKDKGDVGYI